MRYFAIGAALLLCATGAHANDWKKFYHPLDASPSAEPATADPVLSPSSGNPADDVNKMFEQGYIAIGYSSFSSTNGQTADAMRFGRELKASNVILVTNLTGSSMSSIPITTPTTSTSTTNGTIYGSGGSASFNATTTQNGTRTSYFPIRVNHFDKFALYFQPMRKTGIGTLTRELTPDEISRYQTRHGGVVRAIRDGSPADAANVLPGDVILKIDGVPLDRDSFVVALSTHKPVVLSIVRNGTAEDITVPIPPDWN